MAIAHGADEFPRVKKLYAYRPWTERILMNSMVLRHR